MQFIQEEEVFDAELRQRRLLGFEFRDLRLTLLEALIRRF